MTLPGAVVTRPADRADYVRLCAGQGASNVGNAISLFATPLLVYALTGSPVLLSVVSAAAWLPYPVLGPVAGALVDWWDRRRSMIACDVLRLALVGSVPLCSALGLLTLWWICVVAFWASALTVLFNAAQFALLPRLVPAERLAVTNARLQASIYAGTVAGPLLAGGLLTIVPVTAMFAIDAVSFGVSALSLLAIGARVAPSAAPRGRDLARSVADGLRYVATHPILRLIALMMAIINFLSQTVYAQIVLFASSQLGYDRRGIGLLYAAGGLGVVVCTAAFGRLRSRVPLGPLLLGTLAAMGLAIGLLAATPVAWLAAPFWAAIVGSAILFNTCTSYLRQRVVPDSMLGRANAIAAVFAFTPVPFGVLLGGAAIASLGMPRLVFAAIGAGVVVCALAFSRTRLGAVREPEPAAVRTG